MTRLLSIDPGVNYAGLALWYHDGTLERAWYAESHDWSDLDIDGDINAVVCERPQVYLSNLKAANDLVALGIAAGELVGRIKESEFRVDVTYLLPAQWKGNTPKPKKASDDYVIARRVRAALSPEEIEGIELPKSKKQQTDVWDAIGIGLFFLKRIGRGGVRRAA